jgi:hypothetical protein
MRPRDNSNNLVPKETYDLQFEDLDGMNQSKPFSVNQINKYHCQETVLLAPPHNVGAKPTLQGIASAGCSGVSNESQQK